MDTSKLCEVYIRVKPYLSVRHLSCSPLKNRQEWRVSTSPAPISGKRSHVSPPPTIKDRGNSKENNKLSKYSDYDAIKVLDEHRILVDENRQMEGASPNLKRKKTYTFDNILGKTSDNRTIYESLIQPKLPGLFEGMSFTVIAYGISGSGKTHTIFGSHKQGTKYEQGLLLQTIYDLFDIKDSCPQKQSVEIKISMLEIYNEHVHDQLDDSNTGHFRNKNLQLIENPVSSGVIVQDQSSIPVRNSKELIQTIFKGQTKRAISAGSNNQASSRSHVITEIQILSTDKNDSESKMLSKVRFVDLAGSEKQIVCEDKELINEGSNINKSLLALTNCITVLADEKKRENTHFIPYRNSKLTRILKDSLSGNTPLVMTVCITSNSFFIEETVNSLKYAEKAMAIKVEYSNMNPSSYKYNDSKHAKIYRTKIKEMERQINFLKGVITRGSSNVDTNKRVLNNMNNNDINLRSSINSVSGPNEKTDIEFKEIIEKRQKLLAKKSAIEKQITQNLFSKGEVIGIENEALNEEYNQVLSEFADLSMKQTSKMQTISKLDSLINMCDDRIGKLQFTLKKTAGLTYEDAAEQKRHSKQLNELKEAADILEKNLDLREENQVKLAEIDNQLESKKKLISETIGKDYKEDSRIINQRLLKKYDLKLELLNYKEQLFTFQNRINSVEKMNLELLDTNFEKSKLIEQINKSNEIKKDTSNMSLISTVNTNEHCTTAPITNKESNNDSGFNNKRRSSKDTNANTNSNKNLNPQRNCKKKLKNSGEIGFETNFQSKTNFSTNNEKTVVVSDSDLSDRIYVEYDFENKKFCEQRNCLESISPRVVEQNCNLIRKNLSSQENSDKNVQSSAKMSFIKRNNDIIIKATENLGVIDVIKYFKEMVKPCELESDSYYDLKENDTITSSKRACQNLEIKKVLFDNTKDENSFDGGFMAFNKKQLSSYEETEKNVLRNLTNLDNNYIVPLQMPLSNRSNQSYNDKYSGIKHRNKENFQESGKKFSEAKKSKESYNNGISNCNSNITKKYSKFDLKSQEKTPKTNSIEKTEDFSNQKGKQNSMKKNPVNDSRTLTYSVSDRTSNSYFAGGIYTKNANTNDVGNNHRSTNKSKSKNKYETSNLSNCKKSNCKTSDKKFMFGSNRKLSEKKSGHKLKLNTQVKIINEIASPKNEDVGFDENKKNFEISPDHHTYQENTNYTNYHTNFGCNFDLDIEISKDGSPLCIPPDNTNNYDLESNYRTNMKVTNHHSKHEKSAKINSHRALIKELSHSKEKSDDDVSIVSLQNENQIYISNLHESGNSSNSQSDKLNLDTFVKLESNDTPCEPDSTMSNPNDTETNPMSIASDDERSNFNTNESKNLLNSNQYLSQTQENNSNYYTSNHNKNNDGSKKQFSLINEMSNDTKSKLFIGDLDAYRMNTNSNDDLESNELEVENTYRHSNEEEQILQKYASQRTK